MELDEIEKEVYTALVEDAELLEVLPFREKAIFHYTAPSLDVSRYPIIVYAPISDVPKMHGDNLEITHSVTIRIHVIVGQKRYEADKQKFMTACRLVKEIMTSLGFMRRQTIPFIDNGKVMRLFDFVKGVTS